MKKIIIAPNAFKNSLNAIQAAEAIRRGVEKSRLEAELKLLPIADGGDGTVELIHRFQRGKWISCLVTDPVGNPVKAGFSLIENGKTAVIEMTEASGIKLLEPEDRNPLKTTSRGTGELIKAALDQGVHKIILGIGGSATVDGGCGILHALGVRYRNDRGAELEPVPERLVNVKDIDVSHLDSRLKRIDLVIWCDVKNPLIGEQGAAPVFGPQKGASSEEVDILDGFLRKWAAQINSTSGKDVSGITYGGAAGGIAAGLYGILDARLTDGISAFLELIHFEEAVQKADLVITGEGSLDEQTLGGKGPAGVARLAQKYRIPCIGLAGKIPVQPSVALREMFTVLLPINPELTDLDTALKNTESNLERMGEMAGELVGL